MNMVNLLILKIKIKNIIIYMLIIIKKKKKRNYLNENVKKIKIIIDYQIKSFEGLFEDCECIEYINFKKFYRNNINNMKSMFCGCIA